MMSDHGETNNVHPIVEDLRAAEVVHASPDKASKSH